MPDKDFSITSFGSSKVNFSDDNFSQKNIKSPCNFNFSIDTDSYSCIRVYLF